MVFWTDFCQIPAMKAQEPYRPSMQDGFFLVILLVVSAAFALILAPFFAAILWGVVVAILFAPVNQSLLTRLPGRRNAAALSTVFLIIAIVIVPAIILAMSLIQEATAFYGKIQSGEINFALIFARFQASLPEWAAAFLRRLGLTNFAAARDMLGTGITSSFRTVVAQALLIGQGAFSFLVALGVMLYLTFFLLRDGNDLARRLFKATPLRDAHRQALIEKFVIVIRATIKGSIVVAILQGLIGGAIFWALDIEGALLWGVLMGFFSLLPAIGTGLVWVPVAIYLFVTGALWKALALVFCGVFIIGLVDNLLRPILVGRDARMPDYVVLISTLGGIELLGFSGIIIGPVIAALFIAIWTLVSDINTTGADPRPIT